MSMINQQAFAQPGGRSDKGVCLRLAVKWAASRLCHAPLSMFLSTTDWVAQKKNKHEVGGGSKSYGQAVAAADKLEQIVPLSPEDRQKYIAHQADTARWSSTQDKQKAYAQAVAQVELEHGDAQAVDRAYIEGWSNRIVGAYDKAVAVRKIELGRFGNWVGLAVGQGALPAGSTFVLCSDYAAGEFQGGHAVAYAEHKLFDPNGGVYESDMSAVAFRFTDLDQYLFAKYGTCVGADCYVLSLV